jgi:CHAT domain-containing protein
MQQKTLPRDHPALAATLNNLASLYRRQGKEAKATALHQHALAIRQQRLGKKHPSVATSLGNLAFLYTESSEYALAEPLYLQALQIALYTQSPERLWHIQANLSDVLARQNKIRAAVFFAKQAVNTLQGLRLHVHDLDESLRQNFLENKIPTYERLINYLLDQARLPEAQQILTMLKEEAYFDFINRDDAAEVRRTLANLNEQEQAWQNHLTATLKVLNTLQARPLPKDALWKKAEQNAKQALSKWLNMLKEAEIQTIVNELEQTALIEQTRADILQSKLANAGEGVVLLQYLPTDKSLHLILTSASKQISHEVMVSRQHLNRLILDFHDDLQDPVKAPIETAQIIYNLIFAPIVPDLEAMQAQRILLSLSGVLHYLPLAALHDGKQYIIEKYALVRHADISFQRQPSVAVKSAKIAAFGVSQALEDFPALPTVEQELNGIVRHTSTDPDGIMPGIINLNQDFTVKSLREALTKEYPFLHIASHFVFKPGTEQASFLLMGDSSHLSLADIRRQLRFDHLELLTLSACDTAVGSGQGQEIEGFSTLAQHQGAKTVLATLWPVNDASTGQFMQQFYRLFSQQKMTKSEALRQVQMTFIQSAKITKSVEDTHINYPYFYSRPYYWAPFILLDNDL